MLCTNCSHPVVPVVAVDIDGTLGDYHGHFLTFAASYWRRPDYARLAWAGDLNMHVPMGITLEEYRETKLAYRQGGLKRWMPLMYGANMLLHDLKQEGIEVWIATTRPYLRLDNIDPDTRFWLDSNRLPYDHLLYGEDKYQQLAQAVQWGRVLAIVDDLPEQLAEAHRVLPHAATIQVATPYNDKARASSPAVRLGGLVTVRDIIKDIHKNWRSIHGSR